MNQRINEKESNGDGKREIMNQTSTVRYRNKKQSNKKTTTTRRTSFSGENLIQTHTNVPACCILLLWGHSWRQLLSFV